MTMFPCGGEKEFENPPKNMEELDEWAMMTSNAIVYNALRQFRAGNVTKEEALMIAIYHLAKMNAEQHALLMQKAMREPITMIVPVASMTDR